MCQAHSRPNGRASHAQQWMGFHWAAVEAQEAGRRPCGLLLIVTRGTRNMTATSVFGVLKLGFKTAVWGGLVEKDLTSWVIIRSVHLARALGLAQGCPELPQNSRRREMRLHRAARSGQPSGSMLGCQTAHTVTSARLAIDMTQSVSVAHASQAG